MPWCTLCTMRIARAAPSLKAEMNQRVVFHTLPARERDGDDIQLQLVTIRLGQGTLLSTVGWQQVVSRQNMGSWMQT